ncbi:MULTISPECIES: general secretion pathway protein GspJ [Bradyrhizobium]|uniref:General secretion pathway protein GspJ n=2 Tax=Bradyrhizobium TaxID=374 RepID=A0A9X1RAR9_9BRAD|nr:MULTISPECIES: general secretion pathway protein GspJ [Bradyrhizobium]MCG2628167.1 general secretion pathway protein GspJ [Bradyrhizobium zhengyangense]MCG2643286.1 general secretion pathway protein GspJ [Bradyrhizobium zhengyangense]MCG2670400.1 general secretion pathway protein GspJ [Bradyrhizobium zhengyangense]MDN4985865.1 general secretion pathway protein GspJ [Bradyrhizobium sp. WYCCWR 13022]MDN5002756.1 general secretion pathway protein GspJ [Bradyrhizobium sp. WYCCWR 12677]
MIARDHLSQALHRASIAGFTLFEALAAIVLMGIVVFCLSTIATHWLPSWDRGLARAQRAELIGIALDRLTADLAASQFISANGGSKKPLFNGTEGSVTFVRTVTSPNAKSGLEIVKIETIKDPTGLVLIRSSRPFVLFEGAIDPSGFGNPVVLLRSPYRAEFAYAGPGGVWKANWLNVGHLPAAIRLTVQDHTLGEARVISTTTLIHVDAPALCISGKSTDCTGEPDTSPDTAPAADSLESRRT